MTSHVPFGDSKPGGALFLLPREIRDEVYRLVVRGSYLDTKCLYRYSGKASEPQQGVRPDFAILRVSKSISREATEILYSESVFRFLITCGVSGRRILMPDLGRIKRLAPMIQNVVLDVDRFLVPDNVYELNMGVAVQNFGGLEIRRRSLLVRILGSSKFFSRGQGLPRVCEHLKAFVGFRATTLEALPADWFLLVYPFTRPGVDVAEQARKIRRFQTRIVQTLAEHLEPVLGPASSGFRFDTGNVHIPDSNVSRLGDTSLISYLEFQSNKDSVENQVVKEDQVQ